MLCTPNFEAVEGFVSRCIPEDEKGAPQILPVPNNYHVYMQVKRDAIEKPSDAVIMQYVWKRETNNLEWNGITARTFVISDFSQDDIDWSNWMMTYDSNRYQLALSAYVFAGFSKTKKDTLYIGRFGEYKDGSEPDYTFKGDQIVDPLAHPVAATNRYTPEQVNVQNEAGEQVLLEKTIKFDNIETVDRENMAMLFNGVETLFYAMKA